MSQIRPSEHQWYRSRNRSVIWYHSGYQDSGQSFWLANCEWEQDEKNQTSDCFVASTCTKGSRNAKQSRKTVILFRESKGTKNQGAKDVHKKVTGCMLAKIKKKTEEGDVQANKLQIRNLINIERKLNACQHKKFVNIGLHPISFHRWIYDKFLDICVDIKIEFAYVLKSCLGINLHLWKRL